MKGHFLITRPEYDDTTRYISKWSEEIIALAKKKLLTVVDLRRSRAERQIFLSIMDKRNPRLVVINGHGSDNAIAGEDGKTILQIGDEKFTASKIIYARSCCSLRTLGRSIVDKGADAYLGYDEDFVFFFEPEKISRPLEDKTAKLFMEPSNYVAISLLKGHSVEDSNKRSKDLYRKNIAKLLVAGPKSENYHTIRYLFWDMQHQIAIGDHNAIV